jgi:methionine synthase II (cobalamin-independent)
MTTLNKIIDDIELFCSNHLQINSFYCGQTWNFQSKTNIYPAIILIPSPSTIYDGKIVYNFQLYAIDRMNKDKSNLNEILSDMALVIADVVAEFNDPEYDTYDYFIDDDIINIEPLEEELDDIVAGWVATNFNLSVPYSLNYCNTPKE